MFLDEVELPTLLSDVTGSTDVDEVVVCADEGAYSREADALGPYDVEACVDAEVLDAILDLSGIGSEVTSVCCSVR